MSSFAPNLQQVPSVRTEFGAECRELFSVPPGYRLVGADLSGIELRVLAHFLDDDGQYAEEILKGDIHTANMKAFGLDDRNKSKTAIYAWYMADRTQGSAKSWQRCKAGHADA